jgi:hypothetical protein
MVSFAAHPFGEGMRTEEHQERRKRTSRKKKENIKKEERERQLKSVT